MRLQRAGTDLLIDVGQQLYFGPATLKPLASHVESVLAAGDFVPVDPTQWDRDVATLGAGQPLSRLLWFCALQAGKGQLMAGFSDAARYRLLKWPQTEREFPKHFRIATAMMKGPATLEEVTSACGVTAAEVADFVNANLWPRATPSLTASQSPSPSRRSRPACSDACADADGELSVQAGDRAFACPCPCAAGQ
ncbi:hypothetical protein [Agrilutibacter solisilvae]|uniref:Uncharacterized protein n=1 Tax=Agrilutibacter solisilvae TaxID=2763317 RepID=A0A974XWK6_9GAMM|nr:hypothetical protein [Lysobacter solisilvae]QSX77162.1 hypothetical protein I8J32_010120 [Lysobacter solisilvae]